METFQARFIIQQRKSHLLEILPDELIIVFEDNISIETTKRKVMYSRFFWKIHSFYPNTPVLSSHFVDYVLKGKPLSSRTHSDLLSIVAKDAMITYRLDTPIQKEHMLSLIYEITNDLNSDFSKYVESSVMSVDILDFIEVSDYPIIKEAVNSAKPNNDSIRETYNIILNALKEDPLLKHNFLSKAVKAGMVNNNQLLQCVAIRGFLTEVDGSILPVPVMSNFTKGLNSFYDYLAESRSAAKSLYFSEAPLQDAEYFSRRLQLLCMTIEKISYTDCGSTKYIPWRVNPPIIDELGNTIYPGDIKFMLGKYYLDEDTNTLKQITEIDKTLYGKVLKLRTSLYCKHTNPHEVCEVCFGGLAKNISRFANLGHLCAATMTQQTSQSVLSTKHYDASANSANIILNDDTSRYFITNKAKNSYILKKPKDSSELKIVINRDEAIGLIDVLSIDNVDNINPGRISSIEYIDIITTTNDIEIAFPLYISQGNRRAVLTNEFLKYLKTYKWNTDVKNNFVFHLDNWNYNLPIFKLPEMEYSFSDHSHQIAALVESSIKMITDRLTPQSPVSTLQELFNLVNRKLNVNIAALEVIIYAIMLPAKDSYGLSRNSDLPVLGVSNQVIKNRSLSSAYAYENQLSLITNPTSFFKLDRPDSVFDTFINPYEVVEEYRK